MWLRYFVNFGIPCSGVVLYALCEIWFCCSELYLGKGLWDRIKVVQGHCNTYFWFEIYFEILGLVDDSARRLSLLRLIRLEGPKM